MVDKSSVLQIIGCLMKHPQYLSETDKYNLTPDDFYYRFDKYIFIAIENLYKSGATKINPIDVENFLETNGAAKTIFKSNNGIEYLQDAEYLSEEQNFPYYYKRLKKFNLLESLKKQGIDTK
jgi:replicative DNA helicase